MNERRERKINGQKQKQQMNMKKTETSETEVEDFINVEEFFKVAEKENKKNVGERRELFQKLKRK